MEVTWLLVLLVISILNLFIPRIEPYLMLPRPLVHSVQSVSVAPVRKIDTTDSESNLKINILTKKTPFGHHFDETNKTKRSELRTDWYGCSCYPFKRPDLIQVRCLKTCNIAPATTRW